VASGRLAADHAGRFLLLLSATSLLLLLDLLIRRWRCLAQQIAAQPC
jgi:hypothetical protein